MSRTAVKAYCEANGLELVEELDRRRGVHHVHVNIDRTPQVFRAHGLHNLGLWDDTSKPDWPAILGELHAANLGPCTEPDCEWCHGDGGE